MRWPKKGAIPYHAQFRLRDKGRVIKGLGVCNSLDIEPFGEPKVNNRPLRYDSYFNNILKLY